MKAGVSRVGARDPAMTVCPASMDSSAGSRMKKTAITGCKEKRVARRWPRLGQMALLVWQRGGRIAITLG